MSATRITRTPGLPSALEEELDRVAEQVLDLLAQLAVHARARGRRRGCCSAAAPRSQHDLLVARDAAELEVGDTRLLGRRTPRPRRGSRGPSRRAGSRRSTPPSPPCAPRDRSSVGSANEEAPRLRRRRGRRGRAAGAAARARSGRRPRRSSRSRWARRHRPRSRSSRRARRARRRGTSAITASFSRRRQLAVQQPEAEAREVLGLRAARTPRSRPWPRPCRLPSTSGHTTYAWWPASTSLAQGRVHSRAWSSGFGADDRRRDRRAAGRHLAQLRLVEVAVDEHRRGPRDRRGGHHEHVGSLPIVAAVGALGACPPGQHRALLHAEAVLLVDDRRQPSLRERGVAVEQRVRADEDVDLAVVQTLGDAPAARPRWCGW